MSTQIMPLDNSANQTFEMTVNINGQNLTLNLELRYNEMAGYWVMTISDVNNNLILDSIPLITPGNFLQQYAYLAIGKAYVIPMTATTLDYPDNITLGSTFQLVWSDN